MVLTEKIIGYKTPERILVAGKSFLELYRKDKGKSTLLNSQDGGNINSESLKSVFRSSGNGDVGVMLTGDRFIYNILEFDKLPLRYSQRSEMVEWRLSKVFPGEISDFDHQILALGRKTVLSVLLPLTVKTELAHSFGEAELKEIFIGNSFIEFCNQCRKRDSKQMIVELGDGYGVVGFGQPLAYVRKFMARDLNGSLNELNRTTEYIKKTFRTDISEVNILDNSSALSDAVSDLFRRDHSVKVNVTDRNSFAGGLK